MSERAPGAAALAAALLLCLALLARCADGGAIALAAGAVVAAVALAPGPRAGRRRRPGPFARLREELVAVITVAAMAVVLLHGSLGTDAPEGAATAARLLAIAGIGVGGAPRLPAAAAAAIPLGAVAIALLAAGATSGATAGALEVGLAVVAVVAAAHGLIARRRAHARAAIAAAPGAAIAPTPWGDRPSLLPATALGVAALAAASFGPRIEPGAPAGPEAADGERSKGTVAVSTDGSGEAGEAPPRMVVEFASSVRMDAPRRGLEERGEVVARVEMAPAPESLLLRGCALERVTRDGVFPAAPASDADRRRLEPRAIATQTIGMDIELLAPQEGYLLVAERPDRVLGVEFERAADGLRVAGEPAYPLRYRLLTEQRDPELELHGRVPVLDPALVDLPPALAENLGLRILSEDVVRGDDAHAMALAAARWLRASCVYDERHPVAGGSVLTRLQDFLMRSRRGICVEFATSMVVLLRLQGVPARVAIGYRVWPDLTGRITVRSDDAHAWVEVPLRNAGWVAYDPTPPRATPVGERRVEGSVVDDRGATTTVDPAAEPAGAPRVAPERFARAALGLLLCGWIGWALLARRRTRQQVRSLRLGEPTRVAPEIGDHRARLLHLLQRLGFRPGGAETLRAFVARVPEPSARSALARAIACYERVRFGGAVAPPALGELAAQLDALDRATR